MSTWATSAVGGGAWAVGGAPTDGEALYLATGNTFGASSWGGGEAIIRFLPGPVFSGTNPDFWAPVNWTSLDSTDLDVGGSGPILIDVPGANPSRLALGLGKDGNAYLLNRTNLGGISTPLASLHVASGSIIQAAASYQTAQTNWIVYLRNTSLSTLSITPTSPPTLATNWTAALNGRGSPFVTSTDGTNDVMVWGIGAESDQRLHAFDGMTGSVIFAGGGANELMSGTRRFNTGIAAHGRIYIANDNKVFAFKVPVAPIKLTNLAVSANPFSFSFTNFPGLNFSAFYATNLAMPFTNWTRLGLTSEISPGQYQFTDTNATGAAFYRVRSP